MEIRATSRTDLPAVNVFNRSGSSSIVLVCDHASNRMPLPYDQSLGISEADKFAHIAWDPGALGVSLELSRLLDAPLVASTVSRLIIDCNRDEAAIDLIPEISETTVIPGNANLSDIERRKRIELSHRPFHQAIEELLDERAAKGQSTAVISVHSFTPVYKGQQRPWEIGLISGDNRSLIDPVIDDLKNRTQLQVGDNEPYSPRDGVYYTLSRHGEKRGLPSLMIEIRNDEISTPEMENRWGALLAPVLERAVLSQNGRQHA